MALETDAPVVDTGTPQTPDAATPPVLDDVDDIELAQAKAALDKEPPPATKPDAAPAPEPAAPAAATPAAADQATAAAPATPETPKPAETPAASDPASGPMVPKSRLDQEIGKRSAVELENARLKGENEALKTVTAKSPAAESATPAEPAKSHADRIKEIRAERRELAKKFDNGELSRLQEEEQREALDDREHEIRREALLAEAKAASPQTSARADADESPDLYLEERSEQLEQKHPYTTLITDPRDWDYLTGKAATAIAEAGDPLPEGKLSPKDQLRLRTKVAELTDVYGPMMTGKVITKPAAAAAAPAATTPAPQPSSAAAPKPNGAMSPQAQARKDKLELAQTMPPDLTTAGSSGEAVQVTDAQIERMTDEEITALPQTIRRKFNPLE